MLIDVGYLHRERIFSWAFKETPRQSGFLLFKEQLTQKWKPQQCKFTTEKESSKDVSGSVCSSLSGSYEEKAHDYWGIESGHFINWMHIAGLSTFQKLWGVIPENGMAKKRVRITLTSEFDMRDIGTKEIVLSTKSWLGGKNMPLAWAYLATALLCLIFSIYFTWCYVKYPRKLGDIRDLDWVKEKRQ